MATPRNRALAQGFRLTLLLTAALSLPACVVEPPPGYPHHGPYGDRYNQGGPVDQIDGFVTFEGRCPTLRDHESDRVFALTGNTRALRPGDHVTLSEREVGGNSCGLNAPTLEVVGIDTIWRGDDHRSVYYDASRDGDFDRFIVENRDRGGWYADRYAYRTGNRGPGDDRGGRSDRDGDRQDHGRYGNPPDNPPNNPPDNPPMDPNERYDRNAPPDQANPPEDPDEDEQEELSVTGRLDFGGSCPAIHTPNGDSWDLAGDLGNYHDGDRVQVIGVARGRSSCGGRTLEVSSIKGR
jgi:hypothetical protein